MAPNFIAAISTQTRERRTVIHLSNDDGYINTQSSYCVQSHTTEIDLVSSTQILTVGLHIIVIGPTLAQRTYKGSATFRAEIFLPHKPCSIVTGLPI
jgi:hypothetical protein